VSFDFWQLLAGLGLILFATRQIEIALKDFYLPREESEAMEQL